MGDSQRRQVVVVEAAGCRTREEFLEVLLAAIGAPHWHGRNLDALWDSIVGGGVNEVEPPFVLEVRGLRSGVASDIIELLQEAETVELHRVP